MGLKRVTELIANEDVRAFMKYSLRYHSRPNFRAASPGVPPYLPEDFAQKCPAKVKFTFVKGVGEKPSECFGAPVSKIREVDFSGTKQKIDYDYFVWTTEFPDDETMSALHRFIWLQIDIEKQLKEGASPERLWSIAKPLIYNWIDNYSAERFDTYHSEIFQTYAVAERLVNWVYIVGMLFGEEGIRDEKIATSLYEQALFICNHLEYYGEEFTGNHLGNDGKALFIVGTALQDGFLTEIGQKIIVREVERILTKDGFLREGSVHYQFLVTKNYSDIYHIASFSDPEFAELIRPTVLATLRACGYFVLRDAEGGLRIPFVGDISPDYTPEYLLGFYEEATEDWRIESNEVMTGVFPDWAKLTKGNWTVFSHVNNSLYPNNLTGHFHHDTGSVSAYWDGKPVLIDAGRFTYMSCQRSDRDKSIVSHSGLCIDDKEPELDMRTFYSAGFLDKYASKKPELSEIREGFRIDIAGYKRLRGISSVVRNVEVNEAGDLVIRDVLQGRGLHTVKLMFHVPGENGLETSEKKVRFDKWELEFENTFDTISVFDGECAVSYGVSKPMKTIEAETKVKLPCEFTTVLKRR